MTNRERIMILNIIKNDPRLLTLLSRAYLLEVNKAQYTHPQDKPTVEELGKNALSVAEGLLND